MIFLNGIMAGTNLEHLVYTNPDDNPSWWKVALFTLFATYFAVNNLLRKDRS